MRRKRRPVQYGHDTKTQSETRRRKMKSGKYDEMKILTVSESNIKDQIISFLYATKSIPEHADVTELKFGEADTLARLTNGLVPLIIKFRREVDSSRIDGTKTK
jgi:hypothetical protein